MWDIDSVRELAQTLDAVVVNQPLEDDAFEYHRFREPPYDSQALRALSATLAAPLDRGIDVFGYFKHKDEPTGPRYAAELLRLLGAN